MSPAYIKAVSENLPQAQIVFDHFHVVKLFNEKLSDFRRMLFTTTATESKKIVLKGSRWLLLMGNERLKERDNCEKRFHDALELNKALAIAYYMKEDLRHLWSWRDKTTATWHLDSWIEMARISGVTMLNKFANTLEKHRDGILSFFKYRISTGPLEGTNNKIKTMKRQAYGFRDLEFFKLRRCYEINFTI
jgi:transposase